MKRLFYVILNIFLMSCAEKVSPNTQKGSYVYRLSSSGYKSHYMTCNVFSDETFKGYLYDSPRKNCILMDISAGPKNLFEDNSLFLQMYPFKMLNSTIDYGKSLHFYTIEKATNQTLVESFILDSHIVNVELELENQRASFFKDYKFEICNLDESWEGLQLVIYERRSLVDQDPVPIRVSKILKPPFLIHPEYFGERKGNELMAYHPFANYISKFESDANQYYKLAEKTCSPFQ